MLTAARRRVLAGTGVVALLLAAGCSSDDSEPSGAAGTTGAGSASVPVPSESSPTVTAEPEEPFEPRTITVVMNGDMLLHEGLWSTAEIDASRTGRGDMDFRPLLADMRSVIRPADLSICHMETPLAPVGGPYKGYPLFSAPPAIVPALKWEGYDACTTASNHSIDQGFEGLTRTIADLRAAGIATTGTATTKKASKKPLLIDVGDVKVGLVSATYGTNGLPLPSEQPWSVQLIDTDAIEAKAARARAAGADLVLVALHWGLEYQHAPTPDQEAIAQTLSASPDIDFIYGHHAHVVQPYDMVNKKWVVYGLGNAVAQQDTAVEGVYDGNTCRVTFTERPNGSFKVSKLEYIPTMITHFDGSNPMRWLNVPKSLDDPDLVGLHNSLETTGQRVRDVVGSLGAFNRGVVKGR